jgi:hypothetical protein
MVLQSPRPLIFRPESILAHLSPLSMEKPN